MLVREYAKYAKHSGIPEIKTVLGGFVIRRFMGLWVLIVKSLGLVRITPCICSVSILILIIIVPCGRIWALAWERRAAGTCRLLLREPPNETLTEFKR